MAEQMRMQRLRNAGLLAIALHNLLDSACAFYFAFWRLCEIVFSPPISLAT